LIPAIIYAASLAGAIGAGWVWLSLNAVFLLLWVWFVHQKLEPGLHMKWVLSDIAKISLPVIFTLWGLTFISLPEGGRLLDLSAVAILGLTALLVAIASSSYARPFLLRRVKNG